MSTGATSLGTASLGGGTTRQIGRWGSPVLRRGALDVLAVLLLLGTGAVGFGPVFGDATGYVAAAGGVLAGAAVAVVAVWRRLTALETLLAVVVVYLLLGGPLAVPGTTIGGVVPSVDTLQRLSVLSWQSWRDLLTVSLPASEFEGPAVAPFLAGLVTAVVATGLALRDRWPALTVLSGAAFLTAGIVFGSADAPLASAQGLVFAATALGWLAWRAQRTVPDQLAHFVAPARVRSPRTRLTLLGGVALVTAGGLAVGLVALLGSGDRQVVREEVIPPLDPARLASPLTLFRDLETTKEDDTLFTISSLPEGGRVRLAAMDTYDGNVYNVSDASALFGHAGRKILASSFSLEGEPTEVEVTIGDYDGPWLPGGGDLRGVTFDGTNADAQQDGLYFNPATGTAVTTAGLTEGSSYRLSVVPAPVYRDNGSGLSAKAALGTYVLPTARARVDVAQQATSRAAKATTPLEKIRAVASSLVADGYYSNGSKKVKSLAGHSAGRITLLLDNPSGQIVGDDEQYAVATTLVASALGMPARVVMGFYPNWKEPVSFPLAITGDDVHAWTEVYFEEYGWVPFDSTPPEDKDPQQQRPQQQERHDPQVLPPPEVPEEREPLPPVKSDADQKRPDQGLSLLGILKVVVVVAAIGLLLWSPFGLVLLLKGRRRRLRRHADRVADRISGGWAELTDVAVDLGTSIPRHATRHESAVLLAAQHGAAGAGVAAATVDRYVFGAAEPAEADADAVWTTIDEVRTELLHSLPRAQRLRALFSVTSLLRPSDRTQTRQLVRSLFSRNDP